MKIVPRPVRGAAFSRRSTPHDASAWRDPAYLRNRKVVLAGRPLCAECHRYVATTADHIVPVSQWPKGKPGVHDLANLRPLCRMCNVRLGAQLGARIANAARKQRKNPGRRQIRNCSAGTDHPTTSRSSTPKTAGS
jgi:5-methylcytosine-specific restriction endonuclease McrA